MAKDPTIPAPGTAAPEALRLPVQEGYDAWSQVYDTDGNPLIMLEEPVVRDWLGDVAGRRIVDVGCGTGRHCAWLAQAGARVIGLDVSEGMMARAIEKVGSGKVLFCQHRLPDPLPLAEGSCDQVLCALVGEHLADLAGAFGEFARVVQPGGSVIFTVLHPAMNLAGLTARFFEPDTGREVRVAAFEYGLADYLNPALAAGLQLTEIVERSVTEELAQRAPRSAKYLGWPLLLALHLAKPPP